MKKLVLLLVVGALAVGVAWFVAGSRPGPSITVNQPSRFIGASTPLDIVVDSGGGVVSGVTVALEQQDRVAGLVTRGEAGTDRFVSDDGPGRVRVTHVVGKDNVPGLVSGPARLVVTARRPVLFGLRHVESRATHEVTVRLERPRVSVLSTHHFINQGGSEAIVYRVEPADVSSGVAVGEHEYPGFPASALSVAGAALKDPAVRVAFFSLLHDQPVDTPMQLYARDEAGNTVRVPFDFRVFPKPAKQSRIELPDALLDRVVPAILAGTSEIAPTGSNLDKFLAINGELRRKNAATIRSFAAKTAPDMLWRGEVFHPFTNSAVEAAFADRRTYFYQGKEVDRQVHLGFDLASFTNTPIVAANRGVVLYAADLGIYGNCVIIDHGLGVQSLYAHLSSIGVSPGATVEKSQEIGRSGITGLAGGDHLHFTMLVNGQMVNPVEWWDAHWIEDRILRKLR